MTIPHCDGWFRYQQRVVNLEHDRDAIPVQWNADEDFLSEAGSVVEVESNPEEVVEVMMPQGRPFQEALVVLDTWSLQELVSKWVAVMKNIPRFLKGPFQNALHAMKKLRQQRGVVKNEDVNCFSLHRPPRGGWAFLGTLPNPILHFALFLPLLRNAP